MNPSGENMTYIVTIATVALFFLVFDNALAGKHQSDWLPWRTKTVEFSYELSGIADWNFKLKDSFCFRIPTLYPSISRQSVWILEQNQSALIVWNTGWKFPSTIKLWSWNFSVEHCLLIFTEADYTLDDSFWNEESPVGENEYSQYPPALALKIELLGEVERLLKEYRQNQELVRKIGGHFYQIIYPVQLRHHEKMGISTREVGGSKVRLSLGRRNIMNTTVCHSVISHKL